MTMKIANAAMQWRFAKARCLAGAAVNSLANPCASCRVDIRGKPVQNCECGRIVCPLCAWPADGKPPCAECERPGP